MTNPQEINQEPPASPPTSPSAKKSTIWSIGLVLLAIAGLAGFYQLKQRTPQTNDQIVATVNDSEITRNELDDQLNQLAAVGQLPPLEELGEDRSAVERSVLEQMIGNLLLIKDAEKQGIVVSDSDVDTQYSAIASQIGAQGDDFEQLLADEGMTPESLKQSLREQLLLEAYFSRLSTDHDLTVTDDEVRQMYDAQGGDNDQKPAFEDIEPQIRQQLEQQKLAEVIPVVIADLTAQADVEILL